MSISLELKNLHDADGKPMERSTVIKVLSSAELCVQRRVS